MQGGWEQALDGLQVHLQVPDLWQQEAIRALRSGKDVIVSAPTGAGKTFIFESLFEDGKTFRSDRQAVYTVPTRALANDKWREWKKKGWNVGIATGDVAENLDAPVIVATLETQRERFLAGDGPRLLIIDEYQMIGDRRRGLQYELALALAPDTTQLLLLSGSVANPRHVEEWMTRLERDAIVVETKERPVPLEERHLDELPRAAPRQCRNFWQRLALSTLLSHYGPLLIFATHRKAAEKIAAKVAEALPDDDPIALGDPTLEQSCPKELSRLLKKRVAFHHSGLSFTERAAIVEPLAKAGQLRVIVATMGLAAGINFSVRSVFVSDATYQDGPFQRDVSPDELLQMFGRAGRRGLDETGYILIGDRTPRLSDAHPLELRRQNEVDWPTLIRRMHHAARSGESPIEAARILRDRLFSRQQVSLGFRSVSDDDLAEEPALFGLKPTRKEVLNSLGEWEAVRANRIEKVPLKSTRSFVRGRYRPTESDSSQISSLLPARARLCRLGTAPGEEGSRNAPRRYGMELAIATEKEPDQFYLTKFAQKQARRQDRGHDPTTAYTEEEANLFLPEIFAEGIAPARFEAVVHRGQQLFLTGHFRDVECEAYLDSSDVALLNPRERSVEITSETHVTDHESGEIVQARAGTAVHAWRKLRLIDDQGVPTHRGTLFSFFQGGEGLAIAAALEDPHYHPEEIILHLANLRAGHRFELDTVPHADRIVDSIGSERLAAACRQAHGPVDHEGYLRLGLPIQYGEGAAEVIALMLDGGLHKLLGKGATLEFGPGDVERAFVEWLSLLRHLHHAPDLDDERWMALKAAAGFELKRRDRRSPLMSLPSLPATVLQKAPQHGIRYSAL